MTGPGLPELRELLAIGEQAVFHGEPAAAVGVLEQAVVLAQAHGLVAEVAEAAWLLGVALGSLGRYDGALTVLSPLVTAGSEPDAAAELQRTGALSGSTTASIHRQLGRHAVAREADLAALALTDGSGEAAFDALLGLALAAVGLDEGDEAADRLAQAQAALPGEGSRWWRQRVRLGWTTAEVALFEGRAQDAVGQAAAAVQWAQDAQAPRHVAKGLLLVGLAEVSAGRDEVVGTLRRAATVAEPLAVLPIIWPVRALLGVLLAETDQLASVQSLDAARTAVLTIAADLPMAVRSAWLGRPDVATLLERQVGGSPAYGPAG